MLWEVKEVRLVGRATSQPLTTCTSTSIRPIAFYPLPQYPPRPRSSSYTQGPPPSPLQVQVTGTTPQGHPSSSSTADVSSESSVAVAAAAAAAAGGQVAPSAIFLGRHHGIVASLAKHGQSRKLEDLSRCFGVSNNEGDHRDAGGREGMEREVEGEMDRGDPDEGLGTAASLSLELPGPRSPIP